MLLVDIHKSFGDFALNISFEAGNAAIGLLGASGCGKSMTLRCIAGIVTPDSGKIVLDGKTLFDSKAGINLPPQMRQIGMQFQSYALFPNMTVEQNILAGLHAKGLNKAARLFRAAQMIEKLHLNGLESRRPQQLSGGQQQRVALARILVSEPRILMLDEPFSALDSFSRWQAEQEVQHLLQQFDGTTLLVSHNRDEIYRLCSQVAVYDRGRLDVLADKEELFQNPRTHAAALLTGCKNIERAERAGARQVYVPAWGLTLHTAEPVPDDLHEIGIRAHSFGLASNGNSFGCNIENAMEGPFEVLLTVRPDGAKKSFYWIVDKESYRRLPHNQFMLSVSPKDILPLSK